MNKTLRLTKKFNPLSFFAISRVKLHKVQSLATSLSLFTILLLGLDLSAQITTVTISTTGAGTWTVPEGVTGSITVEVWGAGGSGGGASGKNVTGSGGSGGTYVRSIFSNVIAGTLYNLYVAPQTTAASSGANGNSGDSSWFNTNTILNANGGLGGKSSNGGVVTAVTTGSIGTTIISGGSSLSAAFVFMELQGGMEGMREAQEAQIQILLAQIARMQEILDHPRAVAVAVVQQVVEVAAVQL
ncbi:glycine-rich domain-containing protein [Flavobacterium xanthum]|uniref:Glycine-rich domain-containing protein n=1 Tax=Flavobacterium xanthum TaxID=69322 RepID=A0A1M6WXR7_9FLAO|nr:hypothetical protein [Flavobacterium xanthum]SHK98552.1 hypothetical protein SAMN05443669_100172 [Flavobacterium xanthum]